MFFISRKLWNALYDWYGGGPTLKWKIEVDSHKPASSLLSSPIKSLQEINVKNLNSASSGENNDSEDSIDKKFEKNNYYKNIIE